LLLLHILLYLRVRHGMCVVVILRSWWAPWLLSSLRVVEGGIRHVGIAWLRLRSLRRIRLGRCEVRATADMARVLFQS
jgi:hypothetical protein